MGTIQETTELFANMISIQSDLMGFIYHRRKLSLFRHLHRRQ